MTERQITAIPHLFLEDFEEAAKGGRRALDGNPNYTPTIGPWPVPLPSGRIDEGIGVAKRLLDLLPNFTADPERTLSAVEGNCLILNGLRFAGLLE